MYILRLEVKQHVSALYGHHQVFSFSFKVSLYKLRCGDLPSDYNSSMPLYRRGLYYINIYIYIYIYILSLLVGGVGFILWVSAGCQPPLLQGVAVTRMSMVGLAGTVSHVWDRSRYNL